MNSRKTKYVKPVAFLLTQIICAFFDHGHSDWCEVIPHHSFSLHFSNN